MMINFIITLFSLAPSPVRAFPFQSLAGASIIDAPIYCGKLYLLKMGNKLSFCRNAGAFLYLGRKLI